MWFILEMIITITGTVIEGDSTPRADIKLTGEGTSNSIMNKTVWNLTSGTNNITYRTVLACNKIYAESSNWYASDESHEYTLYYTNQQTYDSSIYYTSNKGALYGITCSYFNATKYNTTITTYSI